MIGISPFIMSISHFVVGDAMSMGICFEIFQTINPAINKNLRIRRMRMDSPMLQEGREQPKYIKDQR